jgi:hypothetical protein
MMKAGATFRDKNRIKKLHANGMHIDNISSLTRVRPEHCKAIVDQIQAGKLKTTPGAARAGGGDYGEGESETAAQPAKTIEAEKPVKSKKKKEKAQEVAEPPTQEALV